MKRKKIISEIKSIVADYYNITVNELEYKSRKRKYLMPRQIAMYFSKKYTKYSFAMIGSEIGNKNHASVMHSDKVVKNEMFLNKYFKYEIDELDREIKYKISKFNNNSYTEHFEGFSVTVHFSKGFLR